jgi:hypothetical protein
MRGWESSKEELTLPYLICDLVNSGWFTAIGKRPSTVESAQCLGDIFGHLETYVIRVIAYVGKGFLHLRKKSLQLGA